MEQKKITEEEFEEMMAKHKAGEITTDEMLSFSRDYHDQRQAEMEERHKQERASYQRILDGMHPNYPHSLVYTSIEVENLLRIVIKRFDELDVSSDKAIRSSVEMILSSYEGE